VAFAAHEQALAAADLDRLEEEQSALTSGAAATIPLHTWALRQPKRTPRRPPWEVRRLRSSTG
jgi:hypothetical protein